MFVVPESPPGTAEHVLCRDGSQMCRGLLDDAAFGAETAVLDGHGSPGVVVTVIRCRGEAADASIARRGRPDHRCAARRRTALMVSMGVFSG